MFKKSKYVALICGAISIAVTVLFYYMIFDNIYDMPMRWMSMTALILAEVIATVKAFAVKRTIFGLSNVTTSIFHIVTVFIFTIVFLVFFVESINWYLILNVLALAGMLLIDVCVLFFGNQTEARDRKLKESQSVVLQCVEKALSLCVVYNNSSYRKELEEITDLLKYSDNSSLTGDEIIIMNQLDEVELMLKNDDEGTGQKLMELKNSIKLRSIKVAGTKRGKY